jgi:hypothetical protein
MVDLVRSGRTPEELSRAFEPGAAAIAGWVRGAGAEDGARPDVTTARPRPSAGNWLACVAGTAGSGRRATSWLGERRSRSKPGGPRPRRTLGGPRPRTGVRVDATEPGRASDPRHGPCSGRVDLGFPRLARPPAVGSAEKRCRPGSRRIRAIHAVPHGTCGAPRVHGPAAGRRRPGRSRACRPPDARGRDRGPQPQAQNGFHGRPGAGAALGRGSRPSRLHR